MNRSRRLFIAGTFGGAAAVALSACGGGGSYSQMAAAPVAPPPPAPPAPAPAPAMGAADALACGATTISSNHGHALVIPSTDLNSTVAIVYSIAGTADHNHLVTVTPQMFSQIRNKTAVVVVSTIGGDGHLHEVTINCA